MKTSIKTIVIAAAALSLAGGSAALAQPYGNARGHDRGYERSYDRGDHRQVERRYDNRQQYRRGQRLDNRYQSSRYTVDHRRHHLRAPPRGYQWRQVDNNYVLAAIAGGLIAEVIYGR